MDPSEAQVDSDGSTTTSRGVCTVGKKHDMKNRREEFVAWLRAGQALHEMI
jgi:hypothetical protein